MSILMASSGPDSTIDVDLVHLMRLFLEERIDSVILRALDTSRPCKLGIVMVSFSILGMITVAFVHRLCTMVGFVISGGLGPGLVVWR